MLVEHIGIVSESAKVPFGQVAQISAALQKQVIRDLAPIWNLSASVDAFERLEDVPTGYCRILICDDIQAPSLLGFHQTQPGSLPYALVLATKDTSVTCSHECLEMLVDPDGNRLVAGDSLEKTQGRVSYLVEVCDPCQASSGYQINGVQVADFYTPNYFDPVGNSATRYSYTGAIKRPHEVLKGGYLTWLLPDNTLWQFQYFVGQGQVIQVDGQPALGQSMREFIDQYSARTHPPVQSAKQLAKEKSRKINVVSLESRDASRHLAEQLRSDISRRLTES